MRNDTCALHQIAYGRNLRTEIIKDGYLDFLHLTELKKIYITEINMRKQYPSSKIKNKRIFFFFFFQIGVPLKGYVAS